MIKKLFIYSRKHRFKLTAVFFVSLFFLLTGLPWFSLGLTFLTVIYFAFKSIEVVSKNYFISLPLTLFAVISLAVLTRLFVFEVYNVPSESMENALFPGDNIIVSKLNYGPAMPRSPLEIPWINLLFYLNKTALAKSDSSWWAYKRLSGFSRVRQGDVMVFKSTTNNKEFLVKRCVGLPGNQLQIINGTILINNRISKTVPTARGPYKVWLNDLKPFIRFADSLSLMYDFANSESRTVAAIYLNSKEHSALKNLKGIDLIEYEIIKSPIGLDSGRFSWSPDNLGPIEVPAKGMQIYLNTRNYILYGGAIKNECAFFYQKDGTFYLNNKPITEYTFKQDYYFMMGDNRNNSYDSRYWGFVPEDHITGKAILKVFSSTPSKGKQPGNFFKKIH